MTVSLILNLIAKGLRQEKILEAYLFLEPEVLKAALKYAAWLADESSYNVERATDGGVPGCDWTGGLPATRGGRMMWTTSVSISAARAPYRNVPES